MKRKWRRDLLLDEALREPIERLAVKEGRSVNNTLERLIRRALEQPPPPA